MVINPIIGFYIPIIRIPIKGGMTISNIATFDHGTYDLHAVYIYIYHEPSYTLYLPYTYTHIPSHTHYFGGFQHYWNHIFARKSEVLRLLQPHFDARKILEEVVGKNGGKTLGMEDGTLAV